VPASVGSAVTVWPGQTKYKSANIYNPVPGDLNGDGDVDLVDLATLLGAYHKTDEGDINGDGNTDIVDLAILLSNYGFGL